MTDMKWCPKCKQNVPLSEWGINAARSDGLNGYCVECRHIVVAASTHRQRLIFLEAMGNKCEFCGFSDWRALQVDHKNGRDAGPRGNTRTKRFYDHVLAHRDDFQLLCANCNWIKRHENDEFKGDRIYDRTIPAERKTGPGRHNAKANAARGKTMKQWYADNPEANEDRIAKIRATKSNS